MRYLFILFVPALGILAAYLVERRRKGGSDSIDDYFDNNA